MLSTVESVIKVTPSIRKKASINVWQRKEEAFNLPLLEQLIRNSLNSQSYQDDQNLFRALRKIDLNLIMKESPGINKYFTCSLFIKRFAWISTNKDGEYRYFSKIKDGYGYYSLDLFDLIGIIYNMTSKKTITYLKENFCVEGVNDWEVEEKRKIDDNISFLNRLPYEDYPNLKLILQKGVSILKSFLEYGKDKINGKHLSDGENAVFFLSTQYFKDMFHPSKSLSTLNQWLNYFAVLGLIEKASNVPIEMQVEAEKQQMLKKKHNHVSFFIIPLFAKVLKRAESRASILNKNRISYHQLTKTLVRSLFGQLVYESVYVQKTHGRREKKKPINRKLEQERCATFFEVYLNEKGFVVKKELFELTRLSQTTFNQIWQQLIEKKRCKTDLPTIEERRLYNLSHRQVIARVIKEIEIETIWENQMHMHSLEKETGICHFNTA